MSTITLILQPSPDGTLHVPLPEELRHGKVRVVATLQAVPEGQPVAGNDEPKSPLEALKEIRKLGGLGSVIPDPVAWQREQRTDRKLHGRE